MVGLTAADSESQRALRTLINTDPELALLRARGWSTTAESFGARLVLPENERAESKDASRIQRLRGIVAGAETRSVICREVDVTWMDRVVEFDAQTAVDYPADSPATTHVPVTASAAQELWRDGRVYGAVLRESPVTLVALTVVTEASQGVIETEFTAVGSSVRGHGVGAAVKAFSVLAEWERGGREFRTGGSCSNVAIRATNAHVGYVETELWITVREPR